MSVANLPFKLKFVPRSRLPTPNQTEQSSSKLGNMSWSQIAQGKEDNPRTEDDPEHGSLSWANVTRYHQASHLIVIVARTLVKS